MEIFIDSANVHEIQKWMRRGVLNGVTTNPSIMLKDGMLEMERGVKEIAETVKGRPVSVEVTSNDLNEMVAQAQKFTSWADNIVVKIPIINEDGVSCLEVIHSLAQQGIKINTTAMLAFNQVMMAAKAGATYLSIFAGRVADEGHDPSSLISMAARWVERWGYGKILVGSIRGVFDIQTAAAAGAHIITVPPQVLDKMLDHKYSRETVKVFNADARKALAEMERREGARDDAPVPLKE
jgi:transaldolase